MRRREPQRDVLPCAARRSRSTASCKIWPTARGTLQAAHDRLLRNLAPRRRDRRRTTHRSGWQGWRPTQTATPPPRWTLPAGPHAVDPAEPIYGPVYLPRKFKIAVGLANDNCVDLYANDIGLMAITEGRKDHRLQRVGRRQHGLHAREQEHVSRRSPSECALSGPEQAIDVCTAIVKVQRDFGNRADRKLARMKYLIANWGLDRFRAKVEEYYGQPLADCHPTDVTVYEDHLGWHEQGDGRFYYGLNVENGRLFDNEHTQLKTALREICHTLSPGIRLTANQSILFTDLAADARARSKRSSTATASSSRTRSATVRRWSMACVAWPTCGLAITEAERALPGMIDQLEVGAGQAGAGQREVHGSHDRLPQRLRTAVQLRYRPGGQGGRSLHGVRRRAISRRPDELHLQGPGAAEEIVPSLVPLFLYFKTAREGSGVLWRFLPPQRR